MKILITGACGFIGSNFLDYFYEKHNDYEFVVVDKLTYAANPEYISKYLKKDNFKFKKIDICNFKRMDELFLEEGFDYVVNFAAESSVDKSFRSPFVFYESNVDGVVNLIKLSLKYHVRRFHQVSTDEVYGPAIGVAFKEDSPLNPTNPYSLTKSIADNLILMAVKYQKLNATISRCTNNFGPNQFYDKLIPLCILKAHNNEPIPLYGDGKNIRDWISVYDHCRAIEMILLKGRTGEIYNIGADNFKSNINIVEQILKIMNKPKDLISYVNDRPNHDFGYAVNSTKIKSELGFETLDTFDEALLKTVNCYLSNFKNNL